MTPDDTAAPAIVARLPADDRHTHRLLPDGRRHDVWASGEPSVDAAVDRDLPHCITVSFPHIDFQRSGAGGCLALSRECAGKPVGQRYTYTSSLPCPRLHPPRSPSSARGLARSCHPPARSQTAPHPQTGGFTCFPSVRAARAPSRLLGVPTPARRSLARLPARRSSATSACWAFAQHARGRYARGARPHRIPVRASLPAASFSRLAARVFVGRIYALGIRPSHLWLPVCSSIHPLVDPVLAVVMCVVLRDDAPCVRPLTHRQLAGFPPHSSTHLPAARPPARLLVRAPAYSPVLASLPSALAVDVLPPARSCRLFVGRAYTQGIGPACPRSSCASRCTSPRPAPAVSGYGNRYPDPYPRVPLPATRAGWAYPCNALALTRPRCRSQAASSRQRVTLAKGPRNAQTPRAFLSDGRRMQAGRAHSRIVGAKRADIPRRDRHRGRYSHGTMASALVSCLPAAQTRRIVVRRARPRERARLSHCLEIGAWLAFADRRATDEATADRVTGSWMPVRLFDVAGSEKVARADGRKAREAVSLKVFCALATRGTRPSGGGRSVSISSRPGSGVGRGPPCYAGLLVRGSRSLATASLPIGDCRFVTAHARVARTRDPLTAPSPGSTWARPHKPSQGADGDVVPSSNVERKRKRLEGLVIHPSGFEPSMPETGFHPAVAKKPTEDHPLVGTLKQPWDDLPASDEVSPRPDNGEGGKQFTRRKYMRDQAELDAAEVLTNTDVITHPAGTQAEPSLAAAVSQLGPQAASTGGQRGQIPVSSWDTPERQTVLMRGQREENTRGDVVPTYYIERKRQRSNIAEHKEEGVLMSELSAGILSEGLAADMRVREEKILVEPPRQATRQQDAFKLDEDGEVDVNSVGNTAAANAAVQQVRAEYFPTLAETAFWRPLLSVTLQTRPLTTTVARLSRAYARGTPFYSTVDPHDRKYGPSMGGRVRNMRLNRTHELVVDLARLLRGERGGPLGMRWNPESLGRGINGEGMAEPIPLEKWMVKVGLGVWYQRAEEWKAIYAEAAREAEVDDAMEVFGVDQRGARREHARRCRADVLHRATRDFSSRSECRRSHLSAASDW
ncbi:uncharacterized protein B0H18DRAFT_1117410 [Fomitopsis serialis]|uniref:uncharacterized protein n=1 Tax=Fomitopsis serialis TaxID=139415 RepID=UPI0020074D80|nr:uncharacterized protein B0H18DRAFT_1117410 [Neoantrodia serialis]KAH9929366.1 hypothetical protein B0H18DRAFT_1117410 [Neoantrodia serialis]